MKRILIALLSVAMLSTLTIAYADTDVRLNEKVDEGKAACSEFETYLLWRKLSDEDLADMGYKPDEIKEIRSFSLEDELVERSKLPYETLSAYGYNREQINILKEYDGSEITEDSIMMTLSSDCSGSFSQYLTSNSTRIRVKYAWQWNIMPVFMMTDKIVLCWSAINANGIQVDATPTSFYSIVRYFNVNTGAYVSGQNSTVYGSQSSVYNYIHMNISMAKNDNYYWAKEGTLYVTFEPDGNYTFNYIDLGAAYGHKKLTGSFSINFPDSSFYSTISFSPSLVVSQETDSSGRVYSSGSVTNYH